MKHKVNYGIILGGLGAAALFTGLYIAASYSSNTNEPKFDNPKEQHEYDVRKRVTEIADINSDKKLDRYELLEINTALDPKTDYNQFDNDLLEVKLKNTPVSKLEKFLERN